MVLYWARKSVFQRDGTWRRLLLLRCIRRADEALGACNEGDGTSMQAIHCPLKGNAFGAYVQRSWSICLLLHNPFQTLNLPIFSHTKELQNAVRTEYIISSSSKSLLQICCEGPFGMVSSPKPFISNERERERDEKLDCMHHLCVWVSQAQATSVWIVGTSKVAIAVKERVEMMHKKSAFQPTGVHLDFDASNLILLLQICFKISDPKSNPPCITSRSSLNLALPVNGRFKLKTSLIITAFDIP